MKSFKQLLTLFVCLLASMTVFAEKISEAEALKMAKAFMPGKEFAVEKYSTVSGSRGIKEPFYIFNVAHNGGFVLVSADDRIEAIMGYSTRGNVDINNIPENFKAWLEGYSRQIAALDEGKLIAPSRAKTRGTKDKITPLLKTTWNQSEPYNLMCPDGDGNDYTQEGYNTDNRCVTGCVATAVAQVMYYYKHPSSSTTAIPSYTSYSLSAQLSELPSTTFKWEKMKDNYGYDETGESANAVAELMRYVGQAFEINYNTGGSSAYIHNDAMINYFGYSKSIHSLSRDNYTTTQWKNMIYEELAKGHPVLYDGKTKPDGGAGHQFVCDGYNDDDGLFHLNWGWGGYLDGYFVLSIADPEGEQGIGGSSDAYQYNQSALINFVPAGTKSKYEAISGWTKFAVIEEMPAEVPITFGDKPVTTYTASYNLDFSQTDDIKAYVATGYDYDSGTVWLTRVKDVPEGMPVMIMGTAKETYDIPVKLTSGTYFKNMFVANTTGNTMTLPQTSGDMTNYYLSNGMFKSSTGSNPIGAGKCYLQIPTVAPTPSVGDSRSVMLNGNGCGSFSATQDLDFTDVEGLKAYAATGYDDATGTIWLTRVKRVSAGTGLLLMGAAGGKYTIPSVGIKSYYANMMVGNTGKEAIKIYTTSGDMTNYYLKGNKLLKADGTDGNSIGEGKAYMQIPTAHVTRSIGDDPTENLSVYDLLELPEVISMQVMTRGIDGGDDTTGIHETIEPEQTNDVYYNLNGQRVNNPGKGLYIHNGKKVVVK